MPLSPEVNHALILHHLADFDEARKKGSFDLMFFSLSDAMEILANSDASVRSRVMLSVRSRIDSFDGIVRREMEKIYKSGNKMRIWG